ncbi:MAG: peptidase T, partial [Spirochaetia bacterium]
VRCMNIETSRIRAEVVERFLRYLRLHTTSDPHAEKTPSTDNQWELLRLLEKELGEIGLEDIDLNADGFLLARLPANTDITTPTIGFMAHVDTSSDVSGAGVTPLVHENYQGGDIKLQEGMFLSPEEYPELAEYRGDTIITSDGTTLLGADDKAGVAEILTALRWLKENPEYPHGEIEAIFTPDEETGQGMNLFPLEKLHSKCCYTMDGGRRGVIEGECFNAYLARVRFTGKVIHLGQARGKLVNAVTMAGTFISMLPRAESPEATDGRYGYYAPFEVKGGLDETELEVYLRDFESDGMDRRVAALHTMAESVEASFPGGKVKVETKKMYSNMRKYTDKEPRVMGLLDKAVRAAGVEPEHTIIRGGTDGARLSEMGIPAPNVFNGGHNFHSPFEWASVNTMTEAVETILHLVGLWTREK